MTLPRADGDLPTLRAERSDNLWILASRPIKTIGEQFDNMAVLISGRRFWLWRAVDDEGGGASDGRHFEILLNLTFGRDPPSKGLPSKA
jgi:hypothetical protein